MWQIGSYKFSREVGEAPCQERNAKGQPCGCHFDLRGLVGGECVARLKACFVTSRGKCPTHKTAWDTMRKAKTMADLQSKGTESAKKAIQNKKAKKHGYYQGHKVSRLQPTTLVQDGGAASAPSAPRTPPVVPSLGTPRDVH